LLDETGQEFGIFYNPAVQLQQQGSEQQVLEVGDLDEFFLGPEGEEEEGEGGQYVAGHPVKGLLDEHGQPVAADVEGYEAEMLQLQGEEGEEERGEQFYAQEQEQEEGVYEEQGEEEYGGAAGDGQEQQQRWQQRFYSPQGQGPGWQQQQQDEEGWADEGGSGDMWARLDWLCGPG
jgi:hypothetical protein